LRPTAPPTAALLEAAEEAIRLVQARPENARRLALSVLARGKGSPDLVSASMAHRALGLVAKEHSDLVAATEHLALAIRLAERAGDPTRAAEARMSLALVLANRGRMTSALRHVDRAADALTGLGAARLRMQRALILQHQDRLDEALDDYRSALPVFRRSHDTLWEARALCNRGVLYTDKGDFRAAETDLRSSLQLCRDLGFDLGVALVQHQLGYLHARRGDVVAALEWFDAAEGSYRTAGVRRPTILFDRGELLLSVRLVAEARRAAEQAVAQLARGRMALRLAEARLMLSQAALLDGDVDLAKGAAEQAARAFSRQGRPGWAALARYARLRAGWVAGDRSKSALPAALRTAAALSDAGWAVAALDARILAARMALDVGRVDIASRELAAAGRARNRGPVELRSRAWHAKALLHLARGQRRQAVTSLRSGMDVLEEHRAGLGATELRAHLSAHGADLAMAGLRLAVEDADPRSVFEWVERWRAGALRARPVRPPEDPALVAEMAELRRVAQEREKLALAGAHTAPLLRREGELEEAIRRRWRRMTGDEAADSPATPSADDLARALGENALVEMAELDGQLHAVVVTVDSVVLRRLGPSAVVADELDALHFALRRLARGYGGAESQDVAVAAAGFAAKQLDSLLLDPLAADLGDRPLVIVPTGTLHSTPWSLLPSCLGRPVTVTPSACLWLAAAGRGPLPDSSTVVLVAGPNLSHASAEVARLNRCYPDATVLVGSNAEVKAVLSALNGAPLAHVAAHGHFRADNPLFSSLALADGPLTVYDLETLHEPPRVLLLSACESALSAVRPGDELMGLAAAVLGLGTRTLIASIIAVPDEQTADLMLAVHGHLQSGCEPAVALCRAQAEAIGGGDRRAIAASAGFLCLGLG